MEEEEEEFVLMLCPVREVVYGDERSDSGAVFESDDSNSGARVHRVLPALRPYDSCPARAFLRSFLLRAVFV